VNELNSHADRVAHQFQRALQQGIPALRDDLPIESFAASLMGSTTEIARVLGVCQQRAHGICEAFDVFGINQDAGVR
jgi:hypothetical protein